MLCKNFGYCKSRNDIMIWPRFVLGKSREFSTISEYITYLGLSHNYRRAWVRAKERSYSTCWRRSMNIPFKIIVEGHCIYVCFFPLIHSNMLYADKISHINNIIPEQKSNQSQQYEHTIEFFFSLNVLRHIDKIVLRWKTHKKFK